MPTISDNIKSMAHLVREVKMTYKLSEQTVMRIVDMNFALAQSGGAPSFGGEEDLPIDLPTGDELEQMTLFPDTPTDIEAVEEGDDDTLATHAPLEN